MRLSSLAQLCEDLFLVRSRQQILKLGPALQELARRTNQLGAMHWLDYFLQTSSVNKPPYLILQISGTPTRNELHPQNIFAAALFFEYRFAGFRTGVFSTDDAVGYRTVISPAEQRARFAERAAHALLNNYADIVLATYESASETLPIAEYFPGRLLGYHERRVGRMLNLAPTYEEMLSRLGRLTRRNLRYYRRHLCSRLELRFIDDAHRHISLEKFKTLNSTSMNPVRSDRELELRWRSCCDPSSFVAGLCTLQGKWLSLVGGWRQDTTTVLHWQLNSAGYEHESIGTIMRSFFLEYEINRGTRKLLMFGGTPHSIRHSFEEDTIADLLICKPTLRSTALRLFARPLTIHSRWADRNHLLQTLATLPMTPYPTWAPKPSDAVISREA